MAITIIIIYIIIYNNILMFKNSYEYKINKYKQKIINLTGGFELGDILWTPVYNNGQHNCGIWKNVTGDKFLKCIRNNKKQEEIKSLVAGLKVEGLNVFPKVYREHQYNDNIYIEYEKLDGDITSIFFELIPQRVLNSMKLTEDISEKLMKLHKIKTPIINQENQIEIYQDDTIDINMIKLYDKFMNTIFDEIDKVYYQIIKSICRLFVETFYKGYALYDFKFDNFGYKIINSSDKSIEQRYGEELFENNFNIYALDEESNFAVINDIDSSTTNYIFLQKHADDMLEKFYANGQYYLKHFNMNLQITHNIKDNDILNKNLYEILSKEYSYNAKERMLKLNKTKIILHELSSSYISNLFFDFLLDNNKEVTYKIGDNGRLQITIIVNEYTKQEIKISKEYMFLKFDNIDDSFWISEYRLETNNNYYKIKHIIQKFPISDKENKKISDAFPGITDNTSIDVFVINSGCYISKKFINFCDRIKGLTYKIGKNGRLQITIDENKYTKRTVYFKDERYFLKFDNFIFWILDNELKTNNDNYKIRHIVQHGENINPSTHEDNIRISNVFPDITDDTSIDVLVINSGSYISKIFKEFLHNNNKGITYEIGDNGRLQITINKHVYKNKKVNIKDEHVFLNFDNIDNNFWILEYKFKANNHNYKIKHIVQHTVSINPSTNEDNIIISDVFPEITDNTLIDLFIINEWID